MPRVARGTRVAGRSPQPRRFGHGFSPFIASPVEPAETHFRVTSEGDQRVTADGDRRIVED